MRAHRARCTFLYAEGEKAPTMFPRLDPGNWLHKEYGSCSLTGRPISWEGMLESTEVVLVAKVVGIPDSLPGFV